MMLTGCSVGAYPVDFFQEMHYSPAIRRQEAPVMSAPSDAIAFAGAGGPVAEVFAPPAFDLMSAEELNAITENPVVLTPAVRDYGAALFVRNCSMCHGASGDLQGIAPLLLAAQFTAAEVAPPADLTSEVTKARSDGELFGMITHGQGTVPAPADAQYPEVWAELTNMPAFKKLLSPEERWLLVSHIRTLQGQ